MKISLGTYELLLIKKPKQKYQSNEIIRLSFSSKSLWTKIHGAIKSCADAHAEIPKALIGSLTKRVYTQLTATNGIPEYMISKNSNNS
jgi:hypothetical protein